MLLGTTLASVGMACWSVFFYLRRHDREFDAIYYAMALLIAGTMLVGPGVFAPFHAKRFGALFAILVGLLAVSAASVW